MEDIYKKFNYPSLAKFKEILKLNNIIVSNKDVKEFLNKQSINQVHKPVTNLKEQNKFIIALSPYEMLQIDLLDYQKYYQQNKGFRFILIGVDIFSRKAYASLLKNKTPESVLDGFLTFDIEPMSVFHDSGNEFKGLFLKYLNDEGIVDLHADIGDHNSLGVIDRFSRTLKTEIAKYMTINDTLKYENKLPDLIEAYNDTPHSSLGNNTPNSVFTDKSILHLVQTINLEKLKYNKKISLKQHSLIKVGDYVRIKNKKAIFQKGYEFTYSKETYKVESIDGDRVTLNDGTKHKIKDLLAISGETEVLPNDNNKTAEKQIKINRKLKQVGITNSNEISEKRTRNAPDRLDL